MTPAAYGRHAFVLSNGGTLVGMSVEPWGVSSTRHRFMY
jgi:hypothetical protein